MQPFIKTMPILICTIFIILGCATTDPAKLTKLATEDTDWRVRRNAAENIGDQALLMKIAREDKYFEVRRGALKNLTDQVVLTKIILEDESPFVRGDALWKLTDQTLLAKVVLESKDDNVCRSAVKKLTDQTTLAKIAVEHRDYSTREKATAKLTDQALLAKIVMNDNHAWVRIAALSRITDQALIARVASGDKDAKVRAYAIGKLDGHDQTLLANQVMEAQSVEGALTAVEKISDKVQLGKIARGPGFPLVRVAAIRKMDDQDPILREIAFTTSGVTNDAGESFARIKLAIYEPRIKLQYPNLRCRAWTRLVHRRYEANQGVAPASMVGEDFTFILEQGEKHIIAKNYQAKFPAKIKSLATSHDLGFISAEVSAIPLLKDFLHLRSFTQEDLGELVYSRIPEVKIAAVLNLTDRSTLAKVATADKDPDVCKAAENRINELYGKK